MSEIIFEGATVDELLDYLATTEEMAAEEVRERIADLRDPDWRTYIEITQTFLKHYPPDIFTGVSGSKGSLFVVAIRNALAALQEQGDG